VRVFCLLLPESPEPLPGHTSIWSTVALAIRRPGRKSKPPTNANWRAAIAVSHRIEIASVVQVRLFGTRLLLPPTVIRPVRTTQLAGRTTDGPAITKLPPLHREVSLQATRPVSAQPSIPSGFVSHLIRFS